MSERSGQVSDHRTPARHGVMTKKTDPFVRRLARLGTREHGDDFECFELLLGRKLSDEEKANAYLRDSYRIKLRRKAFAANKARAECRERMDAELRRSRVPAPTDESAKGKRR